MGECSESCLNSYSIVCVAAVLCLGDASIFIGLEVRQPCECSSCVQAAQAKKEKEAVKKALRKERKTLRAVFKVSW